MDLHEGFALNQALSAFALAALDLLDPEDPGYALDVVSVIEAHPRGSPRPVLLAQQFEARGEAVAAMKADGLEYEERMEALERRLLAASARRPPRAVAADLPADPPVGGPERPAPQVGGPRALRAGDDLR